MNKGKVAIFKLKNLSLLDRLNLFLSELDIGNFSIELKDSREYYITFSNYQNFCISYNISEDMLAFLTLTGTVYTPIINDIHPNKFLNWIKIYFEKDNEKKSINPKSLFLFPNYHGFIFKSEKDGYLYLGGRRQMTGAMAGCEIFNSKLQDLTVSAAVKEVEIYELIILPEGVENIKSSNGFFINKCFYAIGKERIVPYSFSSTVEISESYSKTNDVFYQLVTGIDQKFPYFIKIKDDYFCVIDYGLFLVIIDPNIEIIEEIEDGRIKTEYYKTLQ